MVPPIYPNIVGEYYFPIMDYSMILYYYSILIAIFGAIYSHKDIIKEKLDFEKKLYLYKLMFDKKLKNLSTNEFETLSYIINNWDEIIYLGYKKRSLYAHFTNDTVEKLKMLSLEKIMENYPYKNILRIHRSTIINPDKLISYDDQTVSMTNSIQLPIGTTYKRESKSFHPN
jgi:DNA-binding LytR/AlgR family response regulator